eukprot:SAG25_NODE_672_length_6012_cov_14.256046_6_plen_240_part_00
MASFWAAALTAIYLCNVCSCQESTETQRLSAARPGCRRCANTPPAALSPPRSADKRPPTRPRCLVIEAPWFRFTSASQRFQHTPPLNNAHPAAVWGTCRGWGTCWATREPSPSGCPSRRSRARRAAALPGRRRPRRRCSARRPLPRGVSGRFHIVCGRFGWNLPTYMLRGHARTEWKRPGQISSADSCWRLRPPAPSPAGGTRRPPPTTTGRRCAGGGCGWPGLVRRARNHHDQNRGGD